MSKQDLLDYSSIGGHKEGDILKCLQAVELAHTANEQTRNKKTYALLGIAFDLAAQLTNDAMAWKRFCELDRWQGRKSRPKLDDEVSEIYRFVALRCFSSESGANDDRANKYGRVIDYCRRKGTPAFKVAKFIEDRGFEETYSAAVKEFPIRTKSNVSAEAIADESDKQNAEENDDDNDDDQTKEDSTSLGTENNLADGTGYDDRNATYGKSNRNKAVDDVVVGFRCSRQTQFNRLMKLSKKQRKYVLIECEGHTDEWVNLRIVKFAKPKRRI